jgi:NADH-quinone oxidoreductase subunit K
MIVPLPHVLAFAAAMFVLGLTCVLVRRQLIMILLGIEIMLSGAALTLVGASAHWQRIDGQVFVVLLMAITAAEVAIALAMVFYLRHRKGTAIADHFDRMHG